MPAHDISPAVISIKPTFLKLSRFFIKLIGMIDRPFNRKIIDTVWVSGMLQVRHTSNDVGDSGYTLYAEQVAPYE